MQLDSPIPLQQQYIDRLVTYVINLDRSPERLKTISARLSALGMEFTRIAAVDAQRLTPAQLAALAYRADLLPMHLPYDHVFDQGWRFGLKVRYCRPRHASTIKWLKQLSYRPAHRASFTGAGGCQCLPIA